MKTKNCIFGCDLGSLAESVYLNIPHTDNQRNFSVIVNPVHLTYLVGKTVILNKFSYPRKNIKTLLENNNKVISRVWLGDEYMKNITFDPYLPRINLNVAWNGETVDTLGEENVEMKNPIYFSIDSDVLFFPKVKHYRDSPGEKGEYNFIGYLLYQTGLNLYKNTEFVNLDLVKCKKGIF